MKLKLRLIPYRVPLTKPFRAAWGEMIERQGLMVVAESATGEQGYGEIAPLPGFSPETLADAEVDAKQLTTAMMAADHLPDTSAAMKIWFRELAPRSAHTPSVRFGLSTAVADLAARLAGEPLARWLSSTTTDSIPVNGVMSGEGESLERQVTEFTRRGIQTVKLKVGDTTAGEAQARIQEILSQLPRTISLRLDANGRWSLEEALQVLSGVEPSRIELVEEPLGGGCQDQLEQLHRTTRIDFALDETILDPPRWQGLLRSPAVKAAVLKPTLIGDIWRVGELAAEAVGAGKGIVVTTMFETGIGTAACLHLAATLGDHLLPSGLDTLHYLQRSLIRERFTPVDGQLRLPTGVGLGVSYDPSPHPVDDRDPLDGDPQ